MLHITTTHYYYTNSIQYLKKTLNEEHKMELKLPYLKTENGIFKIRIRIPKNLKPILGKTEFYKSLQTRDPETAKQRYHQVMVEYQTEIQQARHRIGGVKAFKNIPPFPIFSEEEFEKDKQEAIYNQFIKSKEIGTKQIQQEILAGKGVIYMIQPLKPLTYRLKIQISTDLLIQVQNQDILEILLLKQ